jgi:hypothetical protein
VVKIDVEGAEAACLEGAERLLSTVRPKLFCEVSETNAAAVGALLERHGYTLFDAGVAGISGITGAAARQPLRSPAWSTLALPR